MSTIERAIDKLQGKSPSREPEVGVTEEQEAFHPTPDSEAQPEQGQAAPATEKLARKTSEESGAINSPKSLPDDPKRSSSDAPPAPVGPDVADKYVQLDLARLKANNYLTPDEPVNTLAEEFQQIKRRLLGNMVPGISNMEAPGNLIMITSAVPGEGKTYTSVNLALSITREMDRTVLAVDTDIIKSDMSRAFGVLGRPGLFDYLERDDLPVSELLIRTSIPNLVVLPAGLSHGNITEKLASVAMQRLCEELSTRYKDRIVIFDSPPILATTGATALAPMIGQTVMVVEAETTPQAAIKQALQRMDHVKLAGLLLNKTRGGKQEHGYQYGYYQQVGQG